MFDYIFSLTSIKINFIPCSQSSKGAGIIEIIYMAAFIRIIIRTIQYCIAPDSNWFPTYPKNYSFSINTSSILNTNDL
ncbi:Uncharacterised protein [Pseudescherichia vulneris]|nr:Uncharacterised protein [Pseudescherichia vulneris]